MRRDAEVEEVLEAMKKIRRKLVCSEGRKGEEGEKVKQKEGKEGKEQ